MSIFNLQSSIYESPDFCQQLPKGFFDTPIFKSKNSNFKKKLPTPLWQHCIENIKSFRGQRLREATFRFLSWLYQDLFIQVSRNAIAANHNHATKIKKQLRDELGLIKIVREYSSDARKARCYALTTKALNLALSAPGFVDMRNRQVRKYQKIKGVNKHLKESLKGTKIYFDKSNAFKVLLSKKSTVSEVRKKWRVFRYFKDGLLKPNWKFDHGGLYSSKPNVQGLPAFIRNSCLYSNRPLYEVDINGSHLNLARHLSRMPFQKDPYSKIALKTDMDRDTIKAATNPFINGASFERLKDEGVLDNKEQFEKISYHLRSVPFIRAYRQADEKDLAFEVLHGHEGKVIIPCISKSGGWSFHDGIISSDPNIGGFLTAVSIKEFGKAIPCTTKPLTTANRTH